MSQLIEKKLSSLPKDPGVYFHKDKSGEVIYIGKAANLNNRVRQYFQKSRTRDPKTDALVSEITDIDWVITESELDALFLEAELIRRNLPKYNVLLRDDKSSLYVRVSYSSPHPTVTTQRRPLDDGAKYFGPYWSGREIKQALRILRRIFPYSTHTNVIPKRACLLYHLGLCPGLEENKTSLKDYRANLRKLMRYLKGEKGQLVLGIEKEMKTASKNQQFERAAVLRNQLQALKGLNRQSFLYEREAYDISKDRAIQGLIDILGLEKNPSTIEGYDISHMQGTDNVASMVVFKNGLPDKASYRKFKMHLPGNNDFAHINEVITRRLSNKNQKSWGLPDLFLIDGGKGQLSSAIEARDKLGVKRSMIGLAKREEEIMVSMGGSMVSPNKKFLNDHQAFVKYSDDFMTILLPSNSDIVKLLQRIRDESHRFAVSYHSVLKTKRQSSSALDDVPGIGRQTKNKILREFGSKTGALGASYDELVKIVGKTKADNIKKYLS